MEGFLTGIVWNPWVPMRVSFFAWETIWKKILTFDQQKRRGWYLPSRCYLCKSEKKSTNYTFLHCPKAIMLWHLIFALFDVEWVMSLFLIGNDKGIY